MRKLFFKPFFDITNLRRLLVSEIINKAVYLTKIQEDEMTENEHDEMLKSNRFIILIISKVLCME